MNFIILLFIIQFKQIVICSYLNSTLELNDSFHSCPISLLRRKRESTEYTRWRVNSGTTEEFIVKIFDEDISTPRTKQIAAVNIQPKKLDEENIIVSGVRIPLQTPVTSKDINNDYTRFLSLTESNVAKNDIIVLPQQSKKRISPKIIKGKVKYISNKYSDRDDSPPAIPQFLSRSAIAQQFAPITPVVFAKKTSLSPLAPQKNSIDNFVTRTSPNIEMVFPMRTFNIDSFTPFEYIHPQRTTLPPESKNVINRQNNEIKNILEKETENYMNLFYTDEDSECITTKKFETSKYVENTQNNENDDLKETIVLGFQEIDLDDNEEPTNSTVETDDDIDNKMVTCTSLKATTDSKSSKDNITRRRQSICSILHKRKLDLYSQRTLREIVAQLKKWAENSPVAKWVDITYGNYTNMENPIYMMIVDDPSQGQIVSAKETVLIVAGIQGKDHHAVAAAMYLLHQLIERSENHSELLTKYRFWIIPVFNPDGYDYSMTFPRRRDWTKNLRQTWKPCKDDDCVACQEYGISCTTQPCYGVNLDRNFEYQWIPTEELQSEHPCGTLYAGPRQLSEVETHSLTQYLHEQKATLYTFIAYKEGDVLGVMYPYSHTKKKRPLDHIYRLRASRAANAAYSISGRPYVAGQTSEFLPLYAGGIEDWVDGHLGIDNTYTIMMFRPTDARDSKLIMERVVHEAYAATHTLLLHSFEPISPPLVTIRRAKANTVMPTKNNVIFITFIILLGYG